MFKNSLLFFAAFLSIHVSAQQLIKGKIVNEKNQPILFASLGYLHHREGASTDSAGNFQLNLITNDSIKISAVGYEPETIIFSNAADTIIKLTEKSNELSDVIVTQKRRKQHVYLGYYEHTNSAASLLSAQLQIATFITNENKLHGIIDEVHFKLSELRHNEFYLRIRFYKIDSLTRMPGNEISFSDTIIHPKDLHRNNKIDVSKRNIRMPLKGVFISLEWLNTKANTNNAPPQLYANNEALENLTYYNFKETKWFASESPSKISKTFDVPDLEIKVAY